MRLAALQVMARPHGKETLKCEQKKAGRQAS